MPRVGYGIASAPKRFWKWVVRESNEECWIWVGRVDKDGYGRIGVNYKMLRAHRFSYELYVGKIPPDMLVRHTCDNPPCVNPDHLVLGTSIDNVADRVSRQRTSMGEKQAFAKLTEAQVTDLRELHTRGFSFAELGRMYGVNECTVTRAIKRQTWKHV